MQVKFKKSNLRFKKIDCFLYTIDPFLSFHYVHSVLQLTPESASGNLSSDPKLMGYVK